MHGYKQCSIRTGNVDFRRSIRLVGYTPFANSMAFCWTTRQPVIQTSCRFNQLCVWSRARYRNRRKVAHLLEKWQNFCSWPVHQWVEWNVLSSGLGVVSRITFDGKLQSETVGAVVGYFEYDGWGDFSITHTYKHHLCQYGTFGENF